MDVLSALNDIYTESEVDTLLSGKADTSHNHDNRYYTETEIDSQMGGKANTSHSHDDLYYTETEIDSLLSGKADTSHTHDSRYYTETEIDGLLAAKAAASHTHTVSEVSDAGTAATKDVPSSGDATISQCVLGDDSRLSNARTPTTHNHDDLYYTETEIDSLLSGKADTSHSHDQFVPKGGIIFYHSGISGASYPSGTFARCDGTGGTPDLDDKFLLPSSTAGSTGGSSTHTHTPSFSSVNVTPCGGGGTDAAQVNITLGSTNHLPPYYTLITLARIA